MERSSFRLAIGSLVAMAALISAPVLAQPASSAILAKAAEPDLDLSGNQLYIVVLDQSVVDREPATGEPPARSTRAPGNGVDPFGWHRPQVRAIVKRLEARWGIKARTMTSYAMPAFSAYLPLEVADALRTSPFVEEIVPQNKGGMSFSSWASYIDSGEQVNWGKIAIGTDDSVTSSNSVYMIDGAAMMDGSQNPHPDNNISQYALANVACATCGYYSVDPLWRNQAAPGHANHVAGILGAKRNFTASRGINPNQPVINVLKGNTDSELHTALDWVLADAEQHNLYSVANLSSSYSSATGSPDFSLTWRYFRRASNRVLLVQAAGNNRVNACSYAAYPTTNANDGILVVGGIDENGAQAGTYDNSSTGYGTSNGSNYGNCVEVWAPSQRIISSWNVITEFNPVRSLSGTSMAAPHVSALASRYGTSSTTPVERENYIRSKLFATSSVDDASIAIQVPSYTQPASFTVPIKLPILSASADSTAPGTSPSYAVDGLYLTNTWNAGHNAPAWIEFDFGSSRTLKSIRMTPEMSPSCGSVVHQVYAGNTPNPATLVGTYSGNACILEPISTSLTSISARYVRVLSQTSPSPIAWREIEIYGY